MRMLGLGVVAIVGGTLFATQASEPALFLLEIPELGVQVDQNTAVRLPHGNVAHLRIHVRRQPGQVSYGSIFARINTESANVVMTTRSTADGLACDFDLTRRDGFRLVPGRNSIEIAVQDTRRRLYYASFLLETSAKVQDDESGADAVGELPSGRKLAVVIGIARHQFAEQGLKNLAFADRDATAVRDFLLSPEGGAFAREQVTLLLNEDATLDRVRTALFDRLAQTGPDDLVLVYFSGHGVPDARDPRNLYLLAHDSNPDALPTTALTVEALQDLYGRVLKTTHVATFVDASRVAGISRSASGGASANLVHQYVTRYAGGGDRVVLVAGDIGEVSWESETFDGGHGAFTYFLLRGLRGEADRNRDGTVTAAEVRQYVREQVSRATGGQQNPFGVPGPGDGLPLAGLRTRRKGRVLPEP